MLDREIIEQKRRHKIISKFKKSKFDYSKFVKNYYLENKKAYISVRCNDYYDIISDFSIKGSEWIDQEFADFVTEQAYYIPLHYDIVLEICGKFTEEEKARIKKTIKSYFGVKLANAEIEINNNRKRRLLLLLFGILTSIFIYLAYRFIDDSILLLETIFILFWFFLESYLDDRFITYNDLESDKLDAAQLANMTIVFDENEK